MHLSHQFLWFFWCSHVHQYGTFLFSFCASRITSFWLFTLSICHAGTFSSLSHSLSTAVFASVFSCASELNFFSDVIHDVSLWIRELPQHKDTWFSCVGECLHSLQSLVAPLNAFMSHLAGRSRFEKSFQFLFFPF